MKGHTYTITEPIVLLDSLFAQLSSESRTTVKSRLRNRQVLVNNTIVTQFDHPLESGDTVVVTTERTKESLRHPMMRIVYEDADIIVIEKRSGLLSIATDKETRKTAYNILSDYLKRNDPAAKVFVVHRLDRETSGLMMFAKNEQIKFALQTDWENVVVKRRYVAVTEGLIEKPEGEISTYLTESKALIVYATTKENGKIARTSFKVLKTSQSRNLTLVELQLATGRKNQIRAHLNYIGRPIIGDKKYGATKPSPIDRVALHAVSLSFVHPISGERLDFETPIPSAFLKLF